MPPDSSVLTSQNLANVDLTDQVLFGADLQGKQLYGVKIRLTCDTFDGVKLDNRQVALLLLMMGLTDTDPRWKRGLHQLVLSVIGEREYRILTRYIQLA